MITSTKNYTKQNKAKGTDRTLGQMVKAKLYRQKSHTEAYTYTQKEKKGKDIYISFLPKSTSSVWDDFLFI